MAAEHHLCDLLLLKVDRGAGCSVTSLGLRQQAVLTDLTRLLPRLASLQFGELEVRVVPDVQGYRMRLLLRPRQRGLLLDPKNSRSTLEGEAAMLRDDIERVGLRVMRAARDANGTRAKTPGPLPDLMHELLVRRARQDWRFMVEHQQIELPFPDCSRFYEDELVHRVDGVVHAVTEHVIVIRSAEIWALDPKPRVEARMGRLCIEVCAASLTRSTQPQLDANQCGRWRSHVVRLKRCALTSAIVGAVDVSEGADYREAGRPLRGLQKTI